MLISGIMLSSAGSRGQENHPLLQDLHWLSGCWERGGEGWSSVEQWMKPSGSSMLGMSRTVRGDRTVEHEFIILAPDTGGVLTYTAYPSGQKPASFRLVEWSERHAVFENLEHDFPQRVIYRLGWEGEGDGFHYDEDRMR